MIVTKQWQFDLTRQARALLYAFDQASAVSLVLIRAKILL